MVQNTLGESRYVRDNSGSFQYPATTTKKKRQVEDYGIELQREFDGRSTTTQYSTGAPTGLILVRCFGNVRKSLDKKYLKQRGEGEQWSTFRFPKENPPRNDFRLCCQAIAQPIPAGGIMDRLGKFKAPSHKIWEWRLDNEDTRLLHIKGEVIDVYKPLLVVLYATTPN